MAYRVLVPLVIAKNQAGKLIYHWGPGSSGHGHIVADNDPSAAGPIIAWLNDEQREHFLRNGLVEEIDDAPTSAQPQPAPSDLIPCPNAELVDECIAALDRFEVPAGAGAPTARTALRENGQAFGNDTIAAAVRQRKMRAVPLSRTATP
jgi:hypothetical protein